MRRMRRLATLDTARVGTREQPGEDEEEDGGRGADEEDVEDWGERDSEGEGLWVSNFVVSSLLPALLSIRRAARC